MGMGSIRPVRRSRWRRAAERVHQEAVTRAQLFRHVPQTEAGDRHGLSLGEAPERPSHSAAEGAHRFVLLRRLP